MTEEERAVPATEGSRAARSTLVITNLIKLAGLGLAVREIVTTRDPVIIGACVVMMSGAQGLEGVVLKFLERLFAIPDHE